jgi:puromycin-sensitive aminopeptidase
VLSPSRKVELTWLSSRICLANAPEGDDSVYESVLRIFRETDLHEERERCMRALGSSSDPKLLVPATSD